MRVSDGSGTAWQVGTAQVVDGTVTQPLTTLGAAGTYQVTYRVVAADGHPVTGSYTFTLTADGGGSAPGPAPTDVPAAEAGSGRGAALQIGGAAALFLLAAGMVAGRGRRRARQPV